ncbi:uncharacterized protein LOC128225856 [Mya arenaria]|uniref:uncharacterized protein LOC128225856 n=1 Tax=Mya arenaria TaxID=6604 RepID=UPI0022E89247|nr:uncharacterized protein LOC128225856 [Mya arenaria]
MRNLDILNFTEASIKDESIESYEHKQYNPVTGASLNNPGGEIRISIETQDIFTHPGESYLLVEGKLTKADGTEYADDAVVSLTNNATVYLLSNIKYQISSQEIESINSPGQGTTMLGLLKYPDDFSKSQGLNQLWFKDTAAALDDTLENTLKHNTGFCIRQLYIIQSPDPKGTFSFRIPLKHILGFCEDYNKILYGMRQTLTLTRKGNNDTIFRVVPDPDPGAQTGKDNDQTKNSAIFDNVNLSNMHVTLNETRYPAIDYNISFIKQQFSRVYGDAAAFISKFFHMDESVSNPNITPSVYKDLYPLFVFDVSKQSLRLKTSVTDIKVKAQFNAHVPADTQAFALVISDKMLSFQSDGEKMNVIY